MAFLDKLSKMTKDLTDKTTDIIETTKLQSKISTEQTIIAEAKTKIGDIIYKQSLHGISFDADIQEQLAAINVCLAHIEDLQKAIQSIKQDGEETVMNAASGNAANTTIQSTNQSTSSCPNCGSDVNEASKFCPDCGTKIA